MLAQDCPVRTALQVIGGKWKPIVLFYLFDGSRRFGELRRLLPDATQKMLTQQLRELERDGIVARKVYHQVRPRVEYSLTAYGKTLRAVMNELCKWGTAHHAALKTGARVAINRVPDAQNGKRAVVSDR
jgi:DNA-binding HxlR family transcriptional regulator